MENEMKKLTTIHPITPEEWGVWNQSSNSYDPYEHIYDWLENEEDGLLSEDLEQFVWRESGK